MSYKKGDIVVVKFPFLVKGKGKSKRGDLHLLYVVIKWKKGIRM